MNDSDKIVLFDGVCNFCATSVQFIIRHDKTNSLKFSSLQSALGQELLTKYNMSKDLEGVVFIENNKAYFKSAAAFKIVRYFGGFWRILNVFSILPLFVTDFGYDIIAKNRYRWFGKKDSCMIPSPEIRSRFLDV
ncbi:MAG: thiol-disulfide oxidoreductase DCC family protein [Sphingobacteriales bacterium]|nr:thiol-disulfide oxidoreductase DCC family protein [Sphingobacteriales bacterium]